MQLEIFFFPLEDLAWDLYDPFTHLQILIQAI